MNKFGTGLRKLFRRPGVQQQPQQQPQPQQPRLQDVLYYKINQLFTINRKFLETYYYSNKKTIDNVNFIEYITEITPIINDIKLKILNQRISISDTYKNNLKTCIHAIYSILGSTILDDGGNGIKISDSENIDKFYNNLQTKYKIPLTPPSQPSQLPSEQPQPSPAPLNPSLAPQPLTPSELLPQSGGAAAHMKIIKRKRTLGQRKKRGGQELGLANNPGISEFSNTQYLNITPSPLNNLSPIDFSNIPQPFSSGLQPFGASIITQNNQLNPLLGGKSSKGASKASKGASKSSKGASKASKGASKSSKGASEAAAMRAASMMKW